MLIILQQFSRRVAIEESPETRLYIFSKYGSAIEPTRFKYVKAWSVRLIDINTGQSVEKYGALADCIKYLLEYYPKYYVHHVKKGYFEDAYYLVTAMTMRTHGNSREIAEIIRMSELDDDNI